MTCVFAGRGVSRGPPPQAPQTPPLGQAPLDSPAGEAAGSPSLSYLPLDALCAVFAWVKLHSRPFEGEKNIILVILLGSDFRPMEIKIASKNKRHAGLNETTIIKKKKPPLI